jgi:CHAD domain-containing protein
VGKILGKDERAQVQILAEQGETANIRRRAQLLLLYDDGLQTKDVAERVGLSRGRSRYWRRRFVSQRMNVFSNRKDKAPGDGKGASGLEARAPQVELPAPATGDGFGDVTVVQGPGEAGGGQEIAGAVQPEALPAGWAPALDTESVAELLALEGPGVLPEDTLAQAGRKILRYQFAEMLRHEEGTCLGKDIEELHDMRVATRRMRAAFEVFEDAFQKGVLKKHLAGLRATGRALGRVRDLDVFMEKAQRYIQSLPEEQHHGLDPLLEAWSQEREVDRVKMLEYLQSADYDSFKRKFLSFLMAPGRGERQPAKESPAPVRVHSIAPVLVYTRLASVRAFEPILPMASIEQLHALRIEFKKFRYTVEFFREVLGPEIKDVINELKTIQDHLGDLNDADVACKILREFLDGWEARQLGLPVYERQNPEPVVAYLAAKHAERHRLMVTFPEAWSRFNRPELRAELAEAVSVL